MERLTTIVRFNAFLVLQRCFYLTMKIQDVSLHTYLLFLQSRSRRCRQPKYPKAHPFNISKSERSKRKEGSTKEGFGSLSCYQIHLLELAMVELSPVVTDLPLLVLSFLLAIYEGGMRVRTYFSRK